MQICARRERRQRSRRRERERIRYKNKDLPLLHDDRTLGHSSWRMPSCVIIPCSLLNRLVFSVTFSIPYLVLFENFYSAFSWWLLPNTLLLISNFYSAGVLCTWHQIIVQKEAVIRPIYKRSAGRSKDRSFPVVLYSLHTSKSLSV